MFGKRNLPGHMRGDKAGFGGILRKRKVRKPCRAVQRGKACGRGFQRQSELAPGTSPVSLAANTTSEPEFAVPAKSPTKTASDLGGISEIFIAEKPLFKIFINSTYPTEASGEECGASEIIAYALSRAAPAA